MSKVPVKVWRPTDSRNLVGKKAVRVIESGDFFYENDIDGTQVEVRNYSFKRPFGIPVRYHDYEKLSGMSNLDFVEFHLSFQDLQMQVNELFSGKEEIGFAVHAPELFESDHIIDLASTSEEYLEISRQNLIEVVEETRKLKTYFPKTKRPVIVLNAGGLQPVWLYSQRGKSRSI